MILLINASQCKWLDAEHTAFSCDVKDPLDGWISLVCHQYSSGIELTVWESREYLDILPSDDETTYESVRELVEAQTLALFDNVAKDRGYRNALWLASYVSSTNDAFRADALKFIRWRDACRAIVTDLDAAWTAGTLSTMPTAADIMAQMPEMEW